VNDFPIIEDDGWLTYEYKQTVPIPAYLIAIVCGALARGKIGPRSSVWTEKELLAACVHEFSEETESYLKAGEKITGISYEWGNYDMVVLPSAFPYGGMENPCLTFLSSSLLAGDRSLTNVVAHEITHSWAGNLVTNAKWADFWLNEGFTVYIERMILGEVFQSEKYRHFEALCGYNDLLKTVADFGATHEFTKLLPDLTGVDPDEAFSKIPYEKGSLFLFFLETKVGGKEAMQRWLNSYFKQFRTGSVTVEQMKAHFLSYFGNTEKVDKSVLSAIDWDTWLNAPGLPAFDPRSILDKTLSENCDILAKKWRDDGGRGCEATDLQSLKSRQIMYFLDVLLTTAMPMKHDALEKMESLYKLSSSRNVEMAFRWLMLCVKSRYTKIFPDVAHFLSKHGRGLYVKPLYKALHEVDQAVASKIFKDNRHFYHSVIRNAFDGLLNK